MTPNLQVKGIREGLLITLIADDWQDARQTLIEHLDSQAAFYKGARLALDVGDLTLKVADLGPLRSEVSDREISLWAVLGNSAITIQTAQTLGMATRIGKPRPELTPARVETEVKEGEAALLVRRTLRSGFSIQHTGHIIVVGDVNPGAEIIAAGDVIVWGRLRGMVHAGAGGNASAQVCALDLSPTQLRIADLIAGLPMKKKQTQPETARIVNGQITAQAWDPKRRG
jgi:septum site-determining protein MinC